MKRLRLKQAVASLLAAVLLVSNVPPSFASAEEGETDTGPAILFAEPKNEDGEYTGFDPETGILTMELKVRTSQPDYTDTANCRYVSRGYLAFQVDSSSLYPVTCDGTAIIPNQNGTIAFVGGDENKSLGSVFLDVNDGSHTGKRQQITYSPNASDTYSDFEIVMYGLIPEGEGRKFTGSETGLMVTNDNTSAVNTTLYCYLQFTLDPSNLITDTDENGYVTVMSLRFQCVSGGNTAENDKALFSKSIQLPQTQDEIDALLGKFYPTLKVTEETKTLAMGAAGFSEAGMTSVPGGGTARSDKASYYYGENAPQATDWISKPKSPSEKIGCPALDYANMDKKYIVEGLSVQFVNTYGEDEDFELPSTDHRQFPRYQIPETADMERLEEEAEVFANGGWVPEAHTENEEDSKAVPLRYEIYTQVSANSETRPEIDPDSEETDPMDAFLRSIKWRFIFADMTPLDNYLDKITPVGDPYTFTSQTAEYTVQEAVLNITDAADPEYKYNGKKVQKVDVTYTDGRAETMLTPVGVVFDFNEYTEVTCPGEEPEDEETEVQSTTEPGYAPQLRITNKAADMDSYLWDTDPINSLENGQVWLTASYQDPSGGVFDLPNGIRVQLYKNDAVATEVTAETESDLTVTKDDGTTVTGITVPARNSQAEDRLANEGIPFEFTVRDQYGFAYKGTGQTAVKPTVDISLDEDALADDSDIEAALEAKKTTEPFVMEEGTTSGVWNLLYGSGYGINDVVSGASYKISAAFSGAQPWEQSYYIQKEADYFNYLDTTVGIFVENNGVREVTLTVPGTSENERTTTVQFLELANQWRDPEDNSQDDVSEYDIYPGLRNDKGVVLTTNVISKFKVEFIATDENGNDMDTTRALDLSQLSVGKFTYRSYSLSEDGTKVPLDVDDIIPDGTVMYLTVRVTTRGSVSITKENKYKFTFKRAKSELTEMRFVEDGYSMRVPTLAEEAADTDGKMTTLTISVNGYDQYGALYAWTSAEADYGLDPWKMAIAKVTAKEVKDGKAVYTTEPVTDDMHITQTDPGSKHNNKLTISHETEPCTLLVTANFGKTDVSDGMTIQTELPITRAMSKAGEITSFTYNKTVIIPPDNSVMSATTTAVPTIVVKDQYGKTLHYNEEGYEDDYSVVYTAVEPITNPKVHLDRNTGVITVDACAEDTSKISVRATIWQNGAPVYPSLTRDNDTLSVKRMTLKITEIEIDQESVSYEDSTSSCTFTASSISQYSISDDDKTPLVSTDTQKLEWILEEIVLNDGAEDGVIDSTNTVIRRAEKNEDGLEKDTGNIIVSGTEYRDKSSKYVALDKSIGYLRFLAQNRKDAPLRVTITVKIQGTETAVTKDIPIILSESQPKRVFIELAVYNQKIEVPEEGQPDATRNLAAYVTDQFNFRIAGVPADAITWSIDSMKGVTLQGSVLHVDNTCPSGYLGVTAKYTYTDDSGEEKEIYNEVETTIEIHREGSDPARVEITAIRTQGQTIEWTDTSNDPKFEVELPGLNATGTAYTQDSFTFRYRVYDQFGQELTGKPVDLTLVSDTYSMIAGITDNDKGVGTVTFGCTDSWKSAGAPQATGIQIKAALESDENIYKTMTVDLKRAEDQASYAVPVCKYFVPSDRTGFESFILIPSPDYMTANSENGHNGKTWAEYQATVYSQYGTEMPGEKATMKLVDNLTGADRVFAGATLKSTGDDTAVMEVSSLMSDLSLRVKAEPAGGAKITYKESSIPQLFDRGASYVYGAALGKMTDENTNEPINDNETEGDMDGWAVDQEDYVVPEGADEAVKEFHFYGRVIDQYRTTFDPITPYYPVWQFADNYPGIRFADSNPTDSFGNVVGTYVADTDTGARYYDVVIEVTKEALGQGITQRTIGIECLVGYKSASDGIYQGSSATVNTKATHYFKLTKSPSQPKYLFFGSTDEDGQLTVSVNEEGVQTEAWQRPTLEEKSKTFTVDTVVYDQYGYEYAGADPVKLELNISSITNQGAELEPVYAAGTDLEEDPDAEPEKYLITKNGVIMAEFDPATAQITLYTACTLKSLSLTATSGQIKDLTRTITIPIDVDGPNGEQPTYLDIIPAGEEETADITVGSAEDGELTRNYIPVVRNQFGETYQGSASYTMWKLQIADEDGNYTDCPTNSSGSYIVVIGEDEDGNPKSDADWTVSMETGTGNKYVSIHVNPEQYEKPISLRIYSELRKGAADQPLLGISTVLDISVARKRSSAGSGGQNMYTVVYNAGSHGSLKGILEEVVLAGDRPVQVPDVIPDAKWGIKGWRANNGEIVDDPSEVEIWRDQEFTVVYNDITKYAFLSGYDDNTVRPDKAVTRGEFVKMLVLAIDNYDKDQDYSHPFQDVDPKRFYDKYIGYAFSIGVVTGYSDGTFRPEATITRAEAAKMVADAAGLTVEEKDDLTVTFTDVDPNAWYGPYVKALADEGIVSGYKDGTFKPQNMITRAEAVRMLVEIMVDAPSKREINRLRTVGLYPFKDIKQTDWSYPYILRAAGVA